MYSLHTNKSPHAYLFVLLSAILLFPACSCNSNSGSNRATVVIKPAPSADDDFPTRLQIVLKTIDTNNKKINIKTVSDNVAYTYTINGFKPLWLNNNNAVNTYLTELEELKWDGLNPEKYNLSALKQLKNPGDKADVNRQIAYDTAFTHSYLAAANDLLLGEILPKTVDSLWFHKNDTLWDAPRQLAGISDKYPSLSNYRSTVPTYSLLREEYKKYDNLSADNSLKNAINKVENTTGIGKFDTASWNAINTIIRKEVPWATAEDNDTISKQAQLLRWYQGYAGIRQTGKPDSNTLTHLTTQPADMQKPLKANMERIRWMQKDMGNLYVIVDVPLAEFFLRRDGQTAMHMRTVVGKPIRQTPSLDANMANVVINPPWGVPPTILKKDVLPGITKSGQAYLAKKGLKAYDHSGNRIDASHINAKNYNRYSYKQAPGDDNSLGYVKFNLPNPWDIYLHDTPHRGDFVKSYRALSSGCVRLQQPQELAIYILSELEKKNFDQEKLDSMIQTHKTRWEILKTKIPVHIVYLTAFEDTTGNHVRFAQDVYKRDGKLISLLN